MTASRDELHHLIDELPDEQVESIAEDLRRRAQPRTAQSGKAFAWIGAGTANNGRANNSERVDELLAASFARN